MMSKLYLGLALAAVVAFLIGVVYMYGEVKESGGRADFALEASALVSERQVAMMKLRRESLERIQQLQKTLDSQHQLFVSETTRLRVKDKTYAQWQDTPVHPLALSRLERLRDDLRASAGTVSR